MLKTHLVNLIKIFLQGFSKVFKTFLQSFVSNNNDLIFLMKKFIRVSALVAVIAILLLPANHMKKCPAYGHFRKSKATKEVRG